MKNELDSLRPKRLRVYHCPWRPGGCGPSPCPHPSRQCTHDLDQICRSFPAHQAYHPLCPCFRQSPLCPRQRGKEWQLPLGPNRARPVECGPHWTGTGHRRVWSVCGSVRRAATSAAAAVAAPSASSVVCSAAACCGPYSCCSWGKGAGALPPSHLLPPHQTWSASAGGNQLWAEASWWSSPCG